MPAITSDGFRKIRLESNSGAVQGVLAADQQLDTLTLVAGAGITLTPDDSSDKIVIGVLGAVNTATINDILYNGNTSTFGMTVADITVDDLKINNNSLYIDHASNNLILGVTGTGIVNVTNNLQTRHILPAADILYDLGSSTNRFRDLYLSGSTIYIGDATISATGTAINLPLGTTIDSVDLSSSIVPSQSTNANKFLRTNGTATYWDSIPSQFPDQTGATGKFLKTNGSSVVWDFMDLTGYATEAYVTGALGTYTTQSQLVTAISNLVEAAPETLNTLNELAAALGDDPNYATSISTALGLKAPISAPTFTGTVTVPTLNLNNALAVSYGGTGATNKGDALTNLLPTGATAGYVLKTGGNGSYYWAAETGASTIVGTRINSARQAYIATAAQVLFEECPTYALGANQLRVYIGGVRQYPEAYTETSTTSFTLTSGVSAGTKVLAEVDGYVSNQVTATAVTFTPVGDIDSTTVQDALSELDSEKAPLASPTFTGTPSLPSGTTAVTQTAGDNSTKLATTAYVKTAVDDVIGVAPGALNTLNELATALGSDANFSTTVTTSLASKAPLASPTFTGTPSLPSGTTAVTQTAGDNSTKLATTAYVETAVSNLVDAAPGALNTLNELAAALGDDANFSTTITTSIGLKAPLDSPTFTGTVSGISQSMITGNSGYTNMTTYTSGSGNWTIPSGVTKFKVTCVGGGGGSSASYNLYSTGGGGGGATAIKYYSGQTPGNTIAYSVGAGGAAGAFVAGTGQNGVAGGNTTFGSLTAGGGAAGGPGTTTDYTGGAGGTGSGGDLNISGQRGQAGSNQTYSSGGMGGSSFLGAGGYGTTQGGNPGDATSIGAGGGGGAPVNGGTTTDRNGHPGGTGIIIIEY